MILGITGGTGCGKTTLLSAIEKAGGLVLDCDAVYHELLKTDKSLLAAIDARFPGTVENGQLQRKKLGSIVFADPQALLDLNALAAIDAIALFEGGLAELCDVTVAVTAPTEDRVQRLMRRDAIPEEYARNRIAAQPTEAWFRQRCDHVLENKNTQEHFQQKCLVFLRDLGIMMGDI